MFPVPDIKGERLRGMLNRHTEDLMHCEQYGFMALPKQKVAKKAKPITNVLARFKTFTVDKPVQPESTPFAIDIVFTCLQQTDVERLRYALRSIFQYAAWARCIYLVLPDNLVIQWLSDESAQASIPTYVVPCTLLYGTEYANHVPTQNRLSIECHLHKIPQLADNFVYFTESMMVGKPTQWFDFFTKDGYPRYTLTELRIGPTEYKNTTASSLKIMDTLLETRTHRFAAHQALALCKNWFVEAWAHPDIRGYLEQTSGSAQLQDTNVSMLMFLVNWSKFSDLKSSSTHLFLQLSTGTNFENELVSMLRVNPLLFCINVGTINQSQRLVLNTFLQFYYPSKTPVERS